MFHNFTCTYIFIFQFHCFCARIEINENNAYPGTRGYLAFFHSFLIMWRSVWHIPQYNTLNVTSVAPVALQIKTHNQQETKVIFNKILIERSDRITSWRNWREREHQTNPWRPIQRPCLGALALVQSPWIFSSNLSVKVNTEEERNKNNEWRFIQGKMRY